MEENASTNQPAEPVKKGVEYWVKSHKHTIGVVGILFISVFLVLAAIDIHNNIEIVRAGGNPCNLCIQQYNATCTTTSLEGKPIYFGVKNLSDQAKNLK